MHSAYPTALLVLAIVSLSSSAHTKQMVVGRAASIAGLEDSRDVCGAILAASVCHGRATAPGTVDAGNLLADATSIAASGNLPERTQPGQSLNVIHPQAFGARGDTREFVTGGSCRAGSRTVTLGGASLTMADIGKSVLVHGAGQDGAPLQTTIATVANGTSGSLASPCLTQVSNARWQYGTDDTAAVTAAAAAAAVRGGVLEFPPGSYWLASQTQPIPLTGYALSCVSPSTTFLSPYTASGCSILIANRSTAAFAIGQGWAMTGLTFYWPAQDGHAADPVPFPPLLEGSNIVNGLFDSNTVVNAYDTLHVVSAAGQPGIGRVVWSKNRQYSIHIDFNFNAGSPDRVFLDGTNVFEPGTFDDVARVGNQYLTKYTMEHGELVHVDINKASYKTIDGLTLQNFLVNGKRYGVRLVSGGMSVSSLSGVQWDSVLTLLAVEGDFQLASTTIVGGYVYSTSAYDTSRAPPVFDIQSSNSVDFSVTGLNVPFALGSIYADTGSGYRSVTLTGGNWAAWGRTTTPGATYYAALTQNNAASTLNLFGINLSCAPGTGNAAIGVQTGSNRMVAISGSTFSNCATPIALAGASGLTQMSGNVSTGTSGKAAVSNMSGGASACSDVGNLWDKTASDDTARPQRRCRGGSAANGR